jgi:copper(I)-binding protein
MRYLVAAVLLAVPALAHEFQTGTVTIRHPVIYEGPPTLKTAAGYLTITNGGDEADSLIGVRTEGLRASLHKSREADGVMRMSPVDIVEIPAGASVAFEPGGLHVMFMDVDARALREGATLPATLVFEQAGEVGVVFNVEARTGTTHGDHARPTN